MMVITQDDIFNSDCEALVNPVNCVGTMGKGLALEFKLKYPHMFERYKIRCDKKEMAIGKMFVYEMRNNSSPRYIICFPTKTHWNKLSSLPYIASGMIALKKVVKTLEIESIAIPALGCGLGGLDFDDVLDIINEYLNNPLHEERYNKKQLRIYVYPPKNKLWKKNNY